MTIDEELRRGLLAEQLLSNEVYQDSIEKVRQAVYDAWSKSPIRDIEGQSYLRLLLKAVTDIENTIKDVAETGKMAQIQLEQERSLKDRVKQFFN